MAAPANNSPLELEAIALKGYIEASADNDWIAMLICWAVVLQLEHYARSQADC